MAEKASLLWRWGVNIARGLAKPKPNTKWDYIVPLSLVGLQFWMFNYSIAHYEIYDPSRGTYEVIEKSLWDIKNILFAEFSYVIFLVLITFFFTRVQRLVVTPSLISIFLAVVTILKGGTVEQALGLALFSIAFHIFFILGNVSLLIKFGNNSKEKINKKFTTIRSAIAWGVYGFGFQILPFTVAPMMLFGGQANIQFRFPPLFNIIYNLLDPLLQLSIVFYISFFPVLFAIIGFIIETYRAGKEGDR